MIAILALKLNKPKAIPVFQLSVKFKKSNKKISPPQLY